MDNHFCVNCKFYSDPVSYCVFGFKEFRNDSPTLCQSYEDVEEMSKKEFLCHGCMNMKNYGASGGRTFCAKNVIFFNTKKAEGCKLFEEITTKLPVIMLPTAKFSGDRKPKIKTRMTDTEYYWMVE